MSNAAYSFDDRPLIYIPGQPAQARVQPGRPANPRPESQQIEGKNPNIRPSNPRREYAARTTAGFWFKYKDYLAALPKATDDLDRELDTDTCRRMMQDPQINSSIYLVGLASLSRGLRVKPRITDTKDPRYETAVKFQRFVEHNINQLENSFTEVLLDMVVGALCHGNALAEQTWFLKEGGEWDGKLLLQSVKPKPPEVYAYLMDRFGNVPAVATYTGEGEFRHPLSTSPIYVPNQVFNHGIEIPAQNLGPGWEALPIGKFAVMSYRKRFGDPRGQSALRPAYGAWYLLMQLWPEYLKYLTQFASPSIVGTLPEKATSEYNQETGRWEDPLDVLYDELLNYANGTALALRYGSQVDLKWSQTDGGAFTNAIGMLNHQMVKAILHQLLATEEGKHQARAASSTHQDVLNIAVRGIKNMVVSMIQRQIFRPLIAMNFGEIAAETLTPWCSLGDIAPEDKASMIASYAQAGWVIGPSQFPSVDAELEMDVRSAEQAEADVEAAKPAAPFGNPATGNPKPGDPATKTKPKTTPSNTKPKPTTGTGTKRNASYIGRALMAMGERMENIERRIRMIGFDEDEEVEA